MARSGPGTGVGGGGGATSKAERKRRKKTNRGSRPIAPPPSRPVTPRATGPGTGAGGGGGATSRKERERRKQYGPDNLRNLTEIGQRRERNADRAAQVRTAREESRRRKVPTNYGVLPGPLSKKQASALTADERKQQRALDLVYAMQKSTRGTLSEKVERRELADALGINSPEGVRRRAKENYIGPPPELFRAEQKKRAMDPDRIDKIFKSVGERSQARQAGMFNSDQDGGDYAKKVKELEREAKKDRRAAEDRIARDIMAAGGTQEDVGKALEGMAKRNQSPVLKVLHEFLRPSSAVAGGTIAALEGRNPASGAVQGFVKNNRSFREVAKKAGLKGTAATVVGLAGDIAFDPLTYLTFGTTRPAMTAAKAAGEKAARDAAKRGVNRAGVENARRTAERAAYDASKLKSRGVKVGMRGMPVRAGSITRKAVSKRKGVRGTRTDRARRTERMAAADRAYRKSIPLTRNARGVPVPRPIGAARAGLQPVRRGAAKAGAVVGESYVGRAARASTREVSSSGKASSYLFSRTSDARRAAIKPGSATDETLRRLVHSYRPAQLDPLTFDAVRAIGREDRAASSQAIREGSEARGAYIDAFKAAGIPETRHRALIDAVERGTVKDLPKAEREVMEAATRDLASQAQAKISARALKPDQVIRNRSVYVPPKPKVAPIREKANQARLTANAAARDLKEAKDALLRAEGKGQPAAIAAARQDVARANARRVIAISRVKAARKEVKAAEKGLKAHKKAAERQKVLDKEAKAYFPRTVKPVEAREARDGIPVTGGGGRTQNADSLKRRELREPRTAYSAERQDSFVDDIPTLMGVSKASTRMIEKTAATNDKLAGLGVRVTQPIVARPSTGDRATDILEARRFYVRQSNGDLKPVWKESSTAEEVYLKAEKARKAGREVVEVPHHIVEAAWEFARRGSGNRVDKMARVPLYDVALSKWKWLATQPNPGFHIRNLMGDSWNARLGGATANDIRQAMSIMTGAKRELDEWDRLIGVGMTRPLGGPELARGGQVRHYGKTGDLTDAEVVLLWKAHGGSQSFTRTDIPLSGHDTTLANRGVVARHSRTAERAGDALENFSDAREGIVRLASFIRALKRGDSPADAVAYANKHHFDYSDLTAVEAGTMRRIMPFYTFMARNGPLQMASLIQSPGRFANLEKVRDATAELAGLPRDWAEAMPEHMQVQAPFVMPGKTVPGPDGDLPVAISPALPLTDLNMLPLGKDGRFSFEAAKNRIFTSITPFLKLPAELAFKYDTFYRDEIRKDWVPAPTNPELRGTILTALAPLGLAFGKGMPKSHKIRDRRTGKMVDGWPWWVDKLVRQVPLQAIVIGSMTEGRDKRPGDKQMALESYLSGFRQSVIDPNEGILSRAFDDFEKVEAQIKRAKEARQPHESLKKRKGQLQQLIYEASAKTMAEPYFEPGSKGRKKKPGVAKWTGSGTSWKGGR